MDKPHNTLLSLHFDEDAKALLLLDQRLLPFEEAYLTCRTLPDVYDAISDMAVRGAPAIGVAAAYGVALAALSLPDAGFHEALAGQAAHLSAARPTAVNLSWAVSRMMRLVRPQIPAEALRELLLVEARAIHQEDIDSCRRIGEVLLPHLRDGMGILTHCNAGQLAASRYGTALAPIYLGLERGMRFSIYADETRPRLQGSMLTAYELKAAGADVTVLCDNMAASLMANGKIDCCIVGCDRVAKNGDTANKIGTLSVAILARHFGIPFYVAAPTSTIDLACETGSAIPIEARDPDEVACRFGPRTVPAGVKVFNPAFDVTPASLVTGFGTERGMLMPPFAFDRT